MNLALFSTDGANGRKIRTASHENFRPSIGPPSCPCHFISRLLPLWSYSIVFHRLFELVLAMAVSLPTDSPSAMPNERHLARWTIDGVGEKKTLRTPWPLGTMILQSMRQKQLQS